MKKKILNFISRCLYLGIFWFVIDVMFLNNPITWHAFGAILIISALLEIIHLGIAKADEKPLDLNSPPADEILDLNSTPQKQKSVMWNEKDGFV